MICWRHNGWTKGQTNFWPILNKFVITRFCFKKKEFSLPSKLFLCQYELGLESLYFVIHLTTPLQPPTWVPKYFFCQMSHWQVSNGLNTLKSLRTIVPWHSKWTWRLTVHRRNWALRTDRSDRRMDGRMDRPTDGPTDPLIEVLIST